MLALGSKTTQSHLCRGRTEKLVMPVVDRTVAQQHLEAELAPRFACGEPARRPVDRPDLVALDVPAEARADRWFGDSVQSFRVEGLRGEPPGVTDVGDEFPNPLRGGVHMDRHCSAHDWTVTRRRPRERSTVYGFGAHIRTRVSARHRPLPLGCAAWLLTSCRSGSD
jgi:hypothetical protein